jgi:hypothetical protein
MLTFTQANSLFLIPMNPKTTKQNQFYKKSSKNIVLNAGLQVWENKKMMK